MQDTGLTVNFPMRKHVSFKGMYIPEECCYHLLSVRLVKLLR